LKKLFKIEKLITPMHKSSPNILRSPDNHYLEDILTEITNIMPNNY